MNVVDIINSMFIFGGAGYAFANAYKLWKDKQVHGIFISSTVFFTIWTFWSTFYYYTLEQWFSLVFNILMAVGDIVWVFMAYRRSNYARSSRSADKLLG